MLTLKKLETIFQDFPVPALILAATEKFEIIQANNACLGLLKRPLQELCGRPLFEVFPDEEQDNPDSVIKRAQRAIEEAVVTAEPKTPGAVAYHLPERNGGCSLRFFFPDYIPVIDENGSVAYIFHCAREVKGKLEAIGAVPLEIPSGELLEASQNAFLLTTPDGHLLFNNQAACELFGYSRSEFKLAAREQLFDSNDHRLAALLLKRSIDGKARGELTGIKKGGEHFPCEGSSVLFTGPGGVTYCCTEIIDLSRWKQAEAKLQQSEKNLRAIFDHTIEGFVLLDMNMNIVAFNDNARRFISLNAEYGNLTIGASIVEYIDADRKDIFPQMMAQVMTGKRLEYERQYQLPGKEMWFTFAFNPVRENNNIVGICISARDITVRVLAERQVEQSEAKYRKMFDHSPLPIWIYDPQTYRFVEINEEAIRHYGYSREEFLSMTVLDVRPANEREKVKKAIADVAERGTGLMGYWYHIKKNGEQITAEITGHRIRYGEKDAIMVVCRDVTEKMNYMSAIERQNEQLRDIAWRQSHIVRAPVARIMGLTGLALADPSSENVQEILPMLKESADELDVIIREIVDRTQALE
jgi:PAS domain S-box-containing protein